MNKCFRAFLTLSSPKKPLLVAAYGIFVDWMQITSRGRPFTGLEIRGSVFWFFIDFYYVGKLGQILNLLRLSLPIFKIGTRVKSALPPTQSRSQRSQSIWNGPKIVCSKGKASCNLGQLPVCLGGCVGPIAFVLQKHGVVEDGGSHCRYSAPKWHLVMSRDSFNCHGW
jgi:hypothetical protein